MTDGGNKKPDLHVVGGPEVSEDTATDIPWSTREEWLAHGRRLGERVERDRWALGDWACHGEQAYGDLAEAAAKIRIGYGYLGNLKSVARKVEVSRRRETLSWDHHAAIASLPADVGDQLLARAEAEHWPRERMRDEARAASRLGQLEARVEQLSDENARLRESDGDNKEADATRRLRKRLKASRRVVRDEARRAVAVIEEAAVAKKHGNSKTGLAKAAINGFRVLSADIRAARADAAHLIGRIAQQEASPVEASMAMLSGELEEVVREMVERLVPASLDPGSCAELEAAFDERLAVVMGVVDEQVRPAIKGLADGKDGK